MSVNINVSVVIMIIIISGEEGVGHSSW